MSSLGMVTDSFFDVLELLKFLLFLSMVCAVVALTLGPVLAGGVDAVRRLRKRRRRLP